MDKVASKLYNLKSIIENDFSFNIPRYQRLFVWKDEQVKTLFNDILTAAFTNQEMYFIGGILTVKYPKITNCFDLVDGQQRFTTLWLLANEMGSDLGLFTKRNEELRLNFSIRKNVENYFNQLSNASIEDETSKDFEDLTRISKAKFTLQSLINENLKTEDRRKLFSDFVMNNLKMVITEVPHSTDLNKLFETLNNRGVQLSQHEILKAQFLGKIKNKKKRYSYNVLWNACSDMDNYLERSIAYELGSSKEVANTYDKWSQKHNWKNLDSILKEKIVGDNKILSLKEILNNKGDLSSCLSSNDNEDLFHPESNDDEFEAVRSILTFPQLLLHTLRIYLFKMNRDDIQRINEKELLSTFKAHIFPNELNQDLKKHENESIDFINLLMEVREAFDKYVIKWVEEDENNETHLIKKVYKQNQKKGGWTYYLRRQKIKEYDGLALLQSILYHSQQNTTQYWLTPFLNYCLGNPSFEEALKDLIKTDNILFSSMQEDKNLPERTWECMNEYPNIKPNYKVLNDSLGTDFPHYWFYKMEFVLWFFRIQLGKDQEWSGYRMTARNSVEHISPQNPRDSKDKLCLTEMDRFGNLVLVTRSINSEYSDLPYKVKKAKFEDKMLKGRIDSLKSDIIYNFPSWGDKEALEHQNAMTILMDDYFKKTMSYD